ncbi:hypothetical protein [Paenibacillus sp. 1001270B_150601_E10]|uniref:hypothetical protein n=1 Tax=Paenibacillus sp. 1001270B_150601_E10 TaxID=2787079 RepID=UPI00189FDCC4|nr:hypothetical protein [Paenibacillus sp. 1001270B_150601_E10]
MSPERKSDKVATPAEALVRMRMRALSSLFEKMSRHHLPSSSFNHLKFNDDKQNKPRNLK